MNLSLIPEYATATSAASTTAPHKFIDEVVLARPNDTRFHTMQVEREVIAGKQKHSRRNSSKNQRVSKAILNKPLYEEEKQHLAPDLPKGSSKRAK